MVCGILEMTLCGVMGGILAIISGGSGLRPRGVRTDILGGNLTAPFAALKTSFAGVTTAIAAIGAAITGAILQTNEFNLSVNKLHNTLGTSLSVATTWAIAAKEMGISIDDLTGIAAKLETRILKNSDTFTKWGVATKDAHGHALTGAQVLENLATKYGSLGTQQEKNALLASTLGRSWVSSQGLIANLSTALVHAKQVQEDFGLTVTKDGVATSKAYKVATEDVGFAFQGVAKVLADAFMPMVTSLMKSFTQFAKEVLPAVSWAARAFSDVVAAVINIFNDLGIYAAETFDEIIDGFNLVSGVINKILSGDFKGALQAAKDGYKAMADEHSTQVKAALATQLATLKGDYAAQIALATANMEAIAKIEGTKSAHYSEAAKQVQDLRNKQLDQTLKVNEAILSAERAHTYAMSALAIQDLNWRKSQGEITETEFLQQQAAFNARRFAQDLQNLSARRALVAADPVETAKVNAEIQKLEDQRVASEQRTQQQLGLLTGSAGSGFMAGMRKAVNELPTIHQQFAAFGASIHSTMSNSLGKAFDDMIIKGTSWKNAMVNATKAVATAVVSSFTQMAAKYLVDMGIKKGMEVFEAASSAKKKGDAAVAVAAETSKATAIATGSAATVTALATTTTAYSTATAAAIDLAAAETWAAYAPMAFVGTGLAEAQIGIMQGALAQVAAFAKGFSAFAHGGLVTSPTLGLVGEAGPEYIIPETDGRTALQKLINDVLGSMSRTSGYAGAASGFASSSSSSSGQPAPSFQNCYFVGEGKSGMAAAAKQLNTLQQYYSQHYATA